MLNMFGQWQSRMIWLVHVYVGVVWLMFIEIVWIIADQEIYMIKVSSFVIYAREKRRTPVRPRLPVLREYDGSPGSTTLKYIMSSICYWAKGQGLRVKGKKLSSTFYIHLVYFHCTPYTPMDSLNSPYSWDSPYSRSTGVRHFPLGYM
jgi:hypothetical protein